MTAARWRGQQIAAAVWAARRRVFFCERHETRKRPPVCELCLVESLFLRPVRSIAQIMGGRP